MHPPCTKPSILVVEDTPDLVALLERVLVEHGYAVRSVRDGDAGLASAIDDPADLLILDIGLPGRDGLQVIAELRRLGQTTPVLMLTARGLVADRVYGLDAGADDYLVKPFDTDELVARVQALLRRSICGCGGRPLAMGELVLDPLKREASRSGRRLILTQREFALLEYLMRHAGQPVTRAMIAEEIWRETPIDLGETNIVDVYVNYLRKKLDGDHERPLLYTIRGTGYVLDPTGNWGD